MQGGGFFFARSVEVDAEKELLDKFQHGEGRESERDACNGLLEEMRGVRRPSSSAGRNMLDQYACLCEDGASHVIF